MQGPPIHGQRGLVNGLRQGGMGMNGPRQVLGAGDIDVLPAPGPIMLQFARALPVGVDLDSATMTVGDALTVAGVVLETVAVVEVGAVDPVSVEELLDGATDDSESNEIAGRLRAGSPGQRIPVIMLSATVGYRDVEHLLAGGVTYFLPKPLNAAALVDAARALPWFRRLRILYG